jgi:hypothetical protein
MNPALMIISLNPGGDETRFQEDKARFESGDFAPPKTFYFLVSPRRFASQLRRLLKNHANLLERDTVAFPICFFRSKNWGMITEEKVEECLPYMKEIIDKLQPKRIIVISSNTYVLLSRLLNGLYPIDPGTIVKTAKWRTIPIFATYHIVGYHFRQDEWEEVVRKLDLWLSEEQ